MTSPLVPCVTSVTKNVSPSGSESFISTFMVAGISSEVTAVSSTATGAVFASPMVKELEPFVTAGPDNAELFDEPLSEGVCHAEDRQAAMKNLVPVCRPTAAVPELDRDRSSHRRAWQRDRRDSRVVTSSNDLVFDDCRNHYSIGTRCARHPLWSCKPAHPRDVSAFVMHRPMCGN